MRQLQLSGQGLYPDHTQILNALLQEIVKKLWGYGSLEETESYLCGTESRSHDVSVHETSVRALLTHGYVMAHAARNAVQNFQQLVGVIVLVPVSRSTNAYVSGIGILTGHRYVCTDCGQELQLGRPRKA
jgi:hypothetical protein